MSFSSYEQVVIIQDHLISGVSSADLGYQTQTEPLYVAGMGYMDNFISGPTEGQMNISRYLMGSDPIKKIEDEEFVSGGIILDNGQSVGFNRARLLNYRVSCNVGQVVEVQNTFKVYGNLGGGVSPIKRWDTQRTYEENDIASVKKEVDGLSEDEIYKCKVAGTLEEPSETANDWEILSNNSVQATRIAKEMLANKNLIQDREYIIPTQGSIKIKFVGSKNQTVDETLSEFPEYNAILGFNYSRGLDLDSLYALRGEQLKGEKLTDYEAIDVQIIYPIKSTFDFTVSLDNYRLSDMRAFLDYANWDKGRIEQDIDIEIYDPQNMSAAPIMTYSVDRAKMLSENVTSQTADETVLNISFEGYERDEAMNEPWFYNNTTLTTLAPNQDISDGDEARYEGVNISQ